MFQNDRLKMKQGFSKNLIKDIRQSLEKHILVLI